METLTDYYLLFTTIAVITASVSLYFGQRLKTERTPARKIGISIAWIFMSFVPILQFIVILIAIATFKKD